MNEMNRMSGLYDEFFRRLIEVNDETRTEEEHRRSLIEFGGWKQGIDDALGVKFNGDYFYIDKFDSGEMQERPICCGVFLDWESQIKEEK